MHAHTDKSDGLFSPEELVYAAKKKGLDVLCITDHDTMAGCDAAKEAGARLGIDVVAGEEITCGWPNKVHLIGLFLSKPVKPGQPLHKTVEAVHEQGGLAILPHPFMPTYFASVQPGQLAKLLSLERVDGIELLHTTPVTSRRVRQLFEFYFSNIEKVGAAVGGSDSHFGEWDIGRVRVLFPGYNGIDLKQAILNRTTLPVVYLDSERIPLIARLHQQVVSLMLLPLKRSLRRL